MANLTTAEYRALKEHRIGDTPTQTAIRAAWKIHCRELGREVRPHSRPDERRNEKYRKMISRFFNPR